MQSVRLAMPLAWPFGRRRSGLMSKRVQFIVTQLGGNVDPFMLHIYAALAEKERAMISERTKVALRAAKGRGVQLGNPNVGKMNTEAARGS